MWKQVGIIGFAGFAYVAQVILRRHWMFHQLDRNNYAHTAKFIEHDIPTEYYEPGKLGDHVKQWHDGFKLYRIKPGSDYKFDVSNVPDSVILAHKLPEEDILGTESIFCRRAFDYNKPVSINMSQVYKEKGWYASFSKVSRQAASDLWDELKLPFKVEESEMEHGFFSNFDSPTVTSPIHGAPMVNSMAIQFVGRKTWAFFPPKTYLGEDGFRAVPQASVLVPQKVPEEPMDIYLYTSQPGDVLFFSESWGHLVYTHTGPSLMINYRNMVPQNFLRQPITFITALVNHLVLGKAADTNKQTNTWPVTDVSFVGDCLKKMQAALCPNGDITNFDKSFISWLHSRVDKFDSI